MWVSWEGGSAGDLRGPDPGHPSPSLQKGRKGEQEPLGPCSPLGILLLIGAPAPAQRPQGIEASSLAQTWLLGVASVGCAFLLPPAPPQPAAAFPPHHKLLRLPTPPATPLGASLIGVPLISHHAPPSSFTISPSVLTQLSLWPPEGVPGALTPLPSPTRWGPPGRAVHTTLSAQARPACTQQMSERGCEGVRPPRAQGHTRPEPGPPWPGPASVSPSDEGEGVELRVPPHHWGQSLAAGPGDRGRREEGPRGGRRHWGGPRPASVWLPEETRHEVMARTNLNLAGGGGWEPWRQSGGAARSCRQPGWTPGWWGTACSQHRRAR